MFNRIEKSSSKKTDQRYKLFAAIEEFNFEVMPYTLCFKRGWKCQIMEGVSRYKECVRRGRSCDGSGVPVSSLSRIVAES